MWTINENPCFLCSTRALLWVIPVLFLPDTSNMSFSSLLSSDTVYWLHTYQKENSVCSVRAAGQRKERSVLCGEARWSQRRSPCTTGTLRDKVFCSVSSRHPCRGNVQGHTSETSVETLVSLTGQLSVHGVLASAICLEGIQQA